MSSLADHTAAMVEDGDLQNRLIEEARKSLNHHDLYMAKSWFLTASAMFPNSFKIQVRLQLKQIFAGTIIRGD